MEMFLVGLPLLCIVRLELRLSYSHALSSLFQPSGHRSPAARHSVLQGFGWTKQLAV